MKMKLLVPLLVLLVFAGFYGCQSGIQSGRCCGAAGGQQAYFFNIENSITESEGVITAIEAFGTDFDWQSEAFNTAPPLRSSTNVTANGAILIGPGGFITINIPPGVRSGGYLLELQINYDDNEIFSNDTADFRLEDDTGAVIAEGEIDNDGEDIHQTFTLQADLTPFAGTGSVTLFNEDGSDNLELNNYMALLPIEQTNNSGIFVADIRPGSSRVDGSSTTAEIDDWDTDNDDVSTPDNFWTSGDVVFDISDVVSSMTRPVLEFNFGREYYESLTLELYDDLDALIGKYYADDDDDEDMGQTFIIDITAFKNSAFFRLDVDSDTYCSPFIKIYDSASTSGTAVILDVQEGGANYVSHSGKFTFYQTYNDYPDDGMYNDNVGYGAPHWLADPTHAPYGVDGTLVFSIPPVVMTYSNPVLEIMHFAPDSETYTDDICGELQGCPGYYPIEFYLRDSNDDEIAHIFFDEWEDDAAGVLKNQIPLEDFKNSPELKIFVPAVDYSRWSQAAFPGFIKIFDSVN